MSDAYTARLMYVAPSRLSWYFAATFVVTLLGAAVQMGGILFQADVWHRGGAALAVLGSVGMASAWFAVWHLERRHEGLRRPTWATLGMAGVALGIAAMEVWFVLRGW